MQECGVSWINDACNMHKPFVNLMLSVVCLQGYKPTIVKVYNLSDGFYVCWTYLLLFQAPHKRVGLQPVAQKELRGTEVFQHDVTSHHNDVGDIQVFREISMSQVDKISTDNTCFIFVVASCNTQNFTLNPYEN